MFSYADLKELATVSGTCLSIFQPLSADSPQEGPNPGLTAAAKTADRLMAADGLEKKDRDEMLRPVHKIAANMPWKGRSGTLVMFRAPDFTLTDFWPYPVTPGVHYSREFFVLPLLPSLFSQHDYWLLTLSIHAARLFRGSPGGFSEVPLPPPVLKGLSDFIAFDKPDHSLRARSDAGPSVGNMRGVQFGTGTEHEDRLAHLHDFFKAIDRGIRPLLAADPKPLILAAVTRELAIYRNVNTYPHLCPDAIHGSPESLGIETIRERAMALLPGLSSQTSKSNQQQMEKAASRQLLSRVPVEVVDAACTGRVERLILSSGALWSGSSEETINWTVLATVRNSGSVSIVDTPLPPDGFAGILRF